MNKKYLKLQNTWKMNQPHPAAPGPNPKDQINLHCIDGNDIRCAICPEGKKTITCKLNKLCAAPGLQGDINKCEGVVGGVDGLCTYNQDSSCVPSFECMYQGWPKNSLLDKSNEKH